ncbi:MAG: hypothetical protein ACE37H_11695 [Phycisphaeraceae bacterium]
MKLLAPALAVICFSLCGVACKSHSHAGCCGTDGKCCKAAKACPADCTKACCKKAE